MNVRPYKMIVVVHIHCAQELLLPLQVLEDACSSHAPANAHGHHTVVSLSPLHLMHDLDGELGARSPHWVTKCDGSAVDIDLLRI